MPRLLTSLRPKLKTYTSSLNNMASHVAATFSIKTRVHTNTHTLYTEIFVITDYIKVSSG